MRKSLLSLIAFAVGFGLVAIGCDATPKQSQLYEITHDGCTYIIYNGNSYDGGIVHKANCKNPEHSRKDTFLTKSN